MFLGLVWVGLFQFWVLTSHLGSKKKKSRILEEESLRAFMAVIDPMIPADVRDGFATAMGFLSGCRIAELYDMKRGRKSLVIWITRSMNLDATICFCFRHGSFRQPRRVDWLVYAKEAAWGGPAKELPCSQACSCRRYGFLPYRQWIYGDDEGTRPDAGRRLSAIPSGGSCGGPFHQHSVRLQQHAEGGFENRKEAGSAQSRTIHWPLFAQVIQKISIPYLCFTQFFSTDPALPPFLLINNF